MHYKLSNILNDINTVLLPKVCFGCNARLTRGEHLLCTVCRNDLPLTDYSFNEENAVDRIFYGRINIKKASSLLFYNENGIVMNLIHHLKYKNQQEIGTYLGDWYGQLIQNELVSGTIDFVIPVPLHRRKLRKRGYNQVTAFGQRIAYHLEAVFVENILVKTANTRTQTRKSRIGRWFNNNALFALKDKEIFRNKSVLLVDDVITTGATMEMCAKTLMEVEGITIYLSSMAVVPLTRVA